MRKNKVLFLTEASYLNTGYATYGREVLTRLSEEFEVAEFSVYGSAEDPRRKSIPWKSYANMPSKDNERHQQVYNSSPANQFGAWRFERACLDFEPDIVLSIRDFWMDNFVYHSPYRRIFKWAWMPTVDAAPQNIEWVDMFANADYILSYSDWAGEVLKEQGGDKINFMGSAPPSASELLRPMENVREEFGIPEDWKIIGTVMRNQRRKLFPSLFEAFSKYIKKTGDTKTYLYCHTSYPDMGWNIGELLHEYGISSRVLFSYLCQDCGFLEITPFNDARKVCSKCGKYASAPASVGHGVDTETLAKVYNIMDLYVQCANSEGFGLPQVEAAACGTPIACTDYSAMKDVVKYLGAHPIKLAATYKELETGCERAVPCVKSMRDIFEEVLSLSKEDYKKTSNTVRTLYENSYGWDKTAEAWAKVIRESGYADWKIPTNVKPMVDIPTDQPSHSQFLEDLKRAYVYTPDHLNSHFIRNIHSSLIRGTSRAQMDGYYFSEFSPLATNTKSKPVNRQQMIEFMKTRLKNYNIWETVRMDRSQLIDGDEPWLN